MSVNWPLWSQGGMQVEEAVRQRMWRLGGLVALESSQGVSALREVLKTEVGVTQVMVLAGDRQRISQAMGLGGQAPRALAQAKREIEREIEREPAQTAGAAQQLKERTQRG